MTLDERLDKARAFRAKGYNCAQCVLVAFPDITGLDDDAALKTAIGFGGGIGCGEVCGVFSAMAMLRGMQSPGGAADKGPVYADMKKLREAFTGKFGKLLCRELKAPGAAVSCNDLIYNGIEMYHNFACAQ